MLDEMSIYGDEYSRHTSCAYWFSPRCVPYSGPFVHSSRPTRRHTWESDLLRLYKTSAIQGFPTTVNGAGRKNTHTPQGRIP